MLWVGGNPLSFVPRKDWGKINPIKAGWTGPDAHGIYFHEYGGSTSLAVEGSSSNSTDPTTLTRLMPGNCSIVDPSHIGPVDPASWKPGTFCNWLHRNTWKPFARLYYKPSLPTMNNSVFYPAYNVPFQLQNCSHITVANVRLYVVSWDGFQIDGGRDITIRDSHIQWAAEMGIRVGGKGTTAVGLQGGLISNNTITKCACGLYFVANRNSQNSNDITVSYNRFLDIE